MTGIYLLGQADAHGFLLTVVNGRLRVRHEDENPHPEILKLLTEHKDLVIAELTPPPPDQGGSFEKARDSVMQTLKQPKGKKVARAPEGDDLLSYASGRLSLL